MRFWFILFGLMLWGTTPVTAQSGDEARGRIQAFLEDSLSDAGREVRVQGFEGALSQEARIGTLTIADREGIWLTLTNAVLDWNRAALLRGRLEITELSADAVIIDRLPDTEAEAMSATNLPDLPAPEAGGFALPDLPVSVDIARVEISRLALGATVLGQPVQLRMEGAAQLEGGEGSAALQIRRTDGRRGTFAVTGAFSNLTRVLDLALELSEAGDGIAANVLGLPGRPTMDLTIGGTGPIDDYTATARLGTDGAPRLGGTVTLSATDDGRAFEANLSGDLRPMFKPDYRAFFGQETRLTVAGARPAAGGLRLDSLALETEALRLDGALILGSDGWPRQINITGEIADADGDAVLLSLPGPETRINRARLSLDYDAADSETWTFGLVLSELDRVDLDMAEARVTGAGRLIPGDGAPVGSFAGKLDLDLSGLNLADPALMAAIGPAVTGEVTLTYAEDDPLRLTDLALAGEDYALTGDVTISGRDQPSGPDFSGRVNLAASTISGFSALAGRALEGAANLTLEGRYSAFDGAFDLDIDGRTSELAIGEPRLDPLIGGASRLTLSAERSGEGTRLDRLAIVSEAAEISAQALLTSEASTGEIRAVVQETGLIAPQMSGPGTLDARFEQIGQDWRIDATASGPGGASLSLDGTAILSDQAIETAEGALDVSIDDIAPYGWIVGQDQRGGVELSFEGSAQPPSGSFDGALDGALQNLETGIPEADLLMRGVATVAAQLKRDRDKVLVIDRLEVSTPQISADASGSVGPNANRLGFEVTLADVGNFVSEIRGAATVGGTATSEASGPWALEARLDAPGNTRAEVAGQISRNADRADLRITGVGPLAFANRFIAPNLVFGGATFDLALNGPPALSSLSGRVQTRDARLAVPGARLSMTGISATADLSGARAQVTAEASVTSGGRVSVVGPVALAPPFEADLQTTLAAIAVADPSVFQTTVDGNVRINGPLQGGAEIGGILNLGPVEARIPDTFGSTGGGLPGLIHLNEPAATRRTRSRAGLIETRERQSGPDYPLDLQINAPSRIFIRGRGVDAELGGALRLGGTTTNVVTTGQFNLIRGRLDILGKRLLLSDANAQLQGNFDPFIRVVAESQDSDPKIQFTIEGPVSDLDVLISSNPELPEDEILSRFLFGRGLGEISAIQALQIASAIRTLSGAGGNGVVDRLRDNFGLDDLDISTSETGETGVSVGKYINENVYSDVTVESSGNTEVNLNLSITPSLTGRGTVRSDGTTGIGIFLERDY